MAAKAELKAKLSLSKVLWDKTLKSALVDAKAFGLAAGRALATGAKAGFAAIAAGAIGAGVGIAILTKKAYDLGAELKNASDKTGIAVDQLQVLQQVAKEKGIDDISTSIKFMQKNLVEATKKGSGPAAEALDVLGLNAKDLVKKLPIDALKEIGEKIEAIRNPALKTAEAVALFGRSGSELLPLFADRGALGEVRSSIGSQGALLAANAEAFRKVSDRLGRIQLKFQGFGVGVATAILPAMDKITARFDKLDLARAGERFGEAVEPIIEKLSKIDFAAAGDSLVDNMNTALSIAQRIGQIFGPNGAIHAMSMAGIGGTAKALFSPSVQRNDEEENPKQQRQYGISPPSTFFRGADPRGGGVFARELYGPTQDGKPLGSYTPSLSPFGRGVDKAAIRKKEYDDLVGKYGQAAVDKMSQDQINSRPVPHSSALSSGSLRSGGLESGGLGDAGSAYGQTAIIRHGEVVRNQNALVAAGAMSADARSNSGGRNVIRRGDRERLKTQAQTEERAKNSIAMSNKLLGEISQKLDSNTSSSAKQ